MSTRDSRSHPAQSRITLSKAAELFCIRRIYHNRIVMHKPLHLARLNAASPASNLAQGPRPQKQQQAYRLVQGISPAAQSLQYGTYNPLHFTLEQFRRSFFSRDRLKGGDQRRYSSRQAISIERAIDHQRLYPRRIFLRLHTQLPCPHLGGVAQSGNQLGLARLANKHDFTPRFTASSHCRSKLLRLVLVLHRHVVQTQQRSDRGN